MEGLSQRVDWKNVAKGEGVHDCTAVEYRTEVCGVVLSNCREQPEGNNWKGTLCRMVPIGREVRTGDCQNFLKSVGPLATTPMQPCMYLKTEEFLN